MKPFIFEARNGIHIIDLTKTLNQLEAACDFLAASVRKGGKVLLVGTRNRRKRLLRKRPLPAAVLLPPTLVGRHADEFRDYHAALQRAVQEIEKMEADGHHSTINVKQGEQSVIRRRSRPAGERSEAFRHGQDAGRDVRRGYQREHNAVAEARRLRPIVAMVDTNCDPAWWIIRSPNDDAIRSVRLILATHRADGEQAQAEYETKYARRKTLRSAPCGSRSARAAPWLRSRLWQPRLKTAPRWPSFYRERGATGAVGSAFRSRPINNYPLLMKDYFYAELMPPTGWQTRGRPARG